MTENEAKKLIAKFCEDRMNFARGKDMSDKELEDFCKFSYALTLSISSLEEIQQYRAIGTVDECRKAREKQSPKKPKGRCQTRYMWDAAYCPVCDCGVTARWNFCQRCGQSIEWSRGDVDEN